MNLWKNPGKPVTVLQTAARWLLGIMLVIAGTTHLTIARKAFRAQVPDWIPIGKDLTVILSGIVEILLGLALAFWIQKEFLGMDRSIIFVLIFPGNIAQYTEHRDAFGLNTDLARGIRLIFQPLLVAWALWSTGAWAARKLKIAL